MQPIRKVDRRIFSLVAVLAAILALTWWSGQRRTAVVPPAARGPQTTPPQKTVSPLRSLPYASWSDNSVTPTEKTGVLRFDSARAFDGVNVFVQFGELLFMDMTGNVIHRVDVVHNRPGHMGAFQQYDQDHFVLIQSRLALWNISGKEVWSSKLPYHHHIEPLPNGQIWTLGEGPKRVQSINAESDVIDNSFVLFGADGKILREISFAKVLEKDPALLERARSIAAKEKDFLHLNTVKLVREPIRSGGKTILESGWLIFCSRAMNLVGAIDPVEEKIVWVLDADFDGPHSPRISRDGGLLVFDNGKERRNYTRILKFKLADQSIEWEYKATAPEKFHTSLQGAVELLPNGNYLLTESDTGRVIEIAPDHIDSAGAEEYPQLRATIVWEYLNPVMKNETESSGKQVAKRASIQRMIRLAPGEVRLPAPAAVE